MYIQEITAQHRRDFTAIMKCEHCDNEQPLNSGYDDANYHQNVIPALKCKACGKSAAASYEPEPTKYPDDMII